MELEDFCIRLNQIELSNAQRALSILWFHDCKTTGIHMKAGALARTIYNAGLGNPNPTQLEGAIAKTKLALKSKAGFKLKPTERNTIKDWLMPILEGVTAAVDLEHGYLPEAIWKKTRGYIEKTIFK